MLGGRRRRLRALPVNSLIPNILTVLALCAGMTAIRYGLQGRWDFAVFAILVAAILDGLDGRMARLLKGATRFGAELDSLSDFLAFGVAPAMVIFLWSANQAGGLGWIAALAYATCCALRLARFNTSIEDPDRPAWTYRYFTGVAAPAAAGCALLPLLISLIFGGAHPWWPQIDALWLFFIAYLMISRIPTYSLKILRVKREHVLPTLVIVGFGAAVLVSYPWHLLTAMTIAYMLSIPFSVRSQRRLGREPGATEISPPGGAPSFAVVSEDSGEADDEEQRRAGG